jgi:hypothetical protein
MHRKLLVPLIGAGALLVAAGTVAQVASAGEKTRFKAHYSQANAWASGLVGTFTISNPSLQAAGDWELTFGVPGGATVTGVWNATLTASGGTYRVKPLARSRTIAAHGSTDVGLTIASTTPVTPTNCTVGDEPCQVDAVSASRIDAAPPAEAGQPGTDDSADDSADNNAAGDTTGDQVGRAASTEHGPAGSGRTGPLFVPYVSLPAIGRPPLDAIMSGTGADGLNLASLVPPTGQACDLTWGGSTDIVGYAGEITKAVRSKVRVIASIGAAGGVDLARTCATAGALEAPLSRVLDLGVRNLDFTIPGSEIADDAVNLRRAQAIKDLQAKYRGLKVSYTLPVLTGGQLGTVDALARPLAAARRSGAVIDRINLLPVDVSSPLGTVDSLLASARSVDAARGVIDTATGLHEQIMRILGLDAGSAWQALGIVPVLGGEDLTGNLPLPGGVSRLLSFAKANGLGLVGFLPLVSTGTCGSGGLPVLSVPLLDCLDLNVLPHFFEISDTVRRALH